MGISKWRTEDREYVGKEEVGKIWEKRRWEKYGKRGDGKDRFHKIKLDLSHCTHCAVWMIKHVHEVMSPFRCHTDY